MEQKNSHDNIIICKCWMWKYMYMYNYTSSMFLELISLYFPILSYPSYTPQRTIMNPPFRPKNFTPQLVVRGTRKHLQ